MELCNFSLGDWMKDRAMKRDTYAVVERRCCFVKDGPNEEIMEVGNKECVSQEEPGTAGGGGDHFLRGGFSRY